MRTYRWCTLSLKEVQEKLLQAGLEVVGSTPEQLGARMRAELAKAQKLVKDVGIPPID